jgi:hypothetical protein
MTVALWLADVVREAGVRRLVIEDDGILGPPIRRAPRQRPSFEVTRESGGTVRVRCSSSAIFFARRADVETARKVMIVSGVTHDAASLTQAHVLALQIDMQRRAAEALGVVYSRRPHKILLRVDDFPSEMASSDELLRFHDIALENGIHYMLAVTPFLDTGQGRKPLSTSEVKILERVVKDGVELAMHGFTHRSRYSNFASEILHMPGPVLERSIAEADQFLAGFGFSTSVFVAPYNTYDPYTVAILAKRFAAMCGGPESVHSFGYRAGPSSFMRSVYVPSYRGAYDLSDRDLPLLDRLLDMGGGAMLPLAMHWANHIESGLGAFRRICRRITGQTVTWASLAREATRLHSGYA